MKRAWARFVALFRKRGLDAEFDREIASHIELATQDYVERGMSLQEARRLARVKFGAMEASKDAHRDARGFAWLEGFFYDLRFAVRGLRRDRAFTLTAIAILALAIGLNVTVFVVMDAALFRGVPLVQRNDRLVYIQGRSPGGGRRTSYPDYLDWAQAKSIERMALVSGKQIALSDGPGDRALDMGAEAATTNLFAMLGVAPMVGRDFQAGEERVAVLSYSFWVSRFGKRTDIVGHTIYIDHAPVTVIGVMPEGFAFPDQENLWIPLDVGPEISNRARSNYLAIGRLKDGARVESARAEIETIGRRLAAEYPATNRDIMPQVETHARFSLGPDAPMIYGTVWAAAWFVLLIACANLANLTLARTMGRSRELSTRIALGAGRWRMIRQLMTEGLLLAGAGGTLGWWIAKSSVGAWAKATADPYRIFDYKIDAGTLAYLAAVSIIAAILFGIIPVWRVFKLDVNGTLKGDARGVTQGARGKYVASVLVAVQMTLAVVLLAGAGILLRSFMKVVTAEVGVSAPEKVLVGRASVPRDKYASRESRVRFLDLLRARLSAIPGVESTAIANSVPVNNPGTVQVDLDEASSEPQSVVTMASGPDYFRVLGASTISGREFDDFDQGSIPVAIVNQSFVAKYWPGQNAIGKRLRLYARDQGALKPGEWRSVVGVVSNIMQGDPTRQKFVPLIYTPIRENPGAGASFFARTKVPAEQVAAAVSAEVQKLDSEVTLEDFSTLKASFGFRAGRMDVEHVEMGKHASVAPIFAGIALMLAGIGLYAVIAHSVSQRTKEIGVRMALGAALEDIRRLVFREGMLPVGIGLMLGMIASLGVNRVLQSQLVGISPYDPVTMTAAPAVLILIALLGCQIPARRAMRVDPAVALRHD